MAMERWSGPASKDERCCSGSDGLGSTYVFETPLRLLTAAPNRHGRRPTGTFVAVPSARCLCLCGGRWSESWPLSSSLYLNLVVDVQ